MYLQRGNFGEKKNIETP